MVFTFLLWSTELTRASLIVLSCVWFSRSASKDHAYVCNFPPLNLSHLIALPVIRIFWGKARKNLEGNVPREIRLCNRREPLPFFFFFFFFFNVKTAQRGEMVFHSSLVLRWVWPHRPLTTSWTVCWTPGELGETRIGEQGSWLLFQRPSPHPASTPKPPAEPHLRETKTTPSYRKLMGNTV